jgi:hypothetical protein
LEFSAGAGSRNQKAPLKGRATDPPALLEATVIMSDPKESADSLSPEDLDKVAGGDAPIIKVGGTAISGDIVNR